VVAASISAACVDTTVTIDSATRIGTARAPAAGARNSGATASGAV